MSADLTEEWARAFIYERMPHGRFGMFERLADLLAEENTRQNLVSKSSLEMVWVRHFADSAQIVDHVSRETGAWLDLGSGAGFPGLALAIMRPEATIHLVESRKRRVEWLGSAIESLGLANCRMHGQRLELIEPFSVDVVTARAFAPLEKLLNLSAAFSTVRTEWVLPKGRSAAQELHALKKRSRQMFHVEQSATDGDAAILVGRGRIKPEGKR